MTPMDARKILAIDGGASKTDAVILDTFGTVHSWIRGPGSNHQMHGMETALCHLDQVIGTAQKNAGEIGIDLGVFCLAGIDLSIDEENLRSALDKYQFGESITLFNDTFALMASGTTSANAVALVCGTGLNCVARGPGGKSVRFPSLGELSGDFTPGGAWLGIRGLGNALREHDGRGDQTLLSTKVPQHFGLDTPSQVLEQVYNGTLKFHRLAELAKVVLECADQGDAVSQSSVQLLVEESALMANAAITSLEVTASEQIDVVVGGGLFQNERFASSVMDAISLVHSKVTLVRASQPPVLGAGRLGLEELGADLEAFVAFSDALSQMSPSTLIT